MKKTTLFLITLLSSAILFGCGQNSTANTDAELGKASKVIVYQEGSAHTVSPDQPTFDKLVQTAGKAIVEVNDIYKGIDSTESYTGSFDTLVIELSEAKQLNPGKQSGDKIPVRFLVVPLSGKYFEDDQLILAGNDEQFLNMYETDKRVLNELQDLAEQAVAETK